MGSPLDEANDRELRFPTTRMCTGVLLERFEARARDSDVFVTTAAKSGQTWLLTLLFHLKTRGLEPDIRGKGLMNAMPWLELPMDLNSREPYDVDQRLAELEALDDPRVFKMHVEWQTVPRPPTSKSKIVTVTRDPRDLPYSMFRHLQALNADLPDSSSPVDFDTYFEQWMEYGYIFKFVRSFWPHRGDDDVLWLRFEDMKGDLESEARKIIAFLGWAVDERALGRVLPRVDFAYMQSVEKSKLMVGLEKSWRTDQRFFREGAIGKNRARLNTSQEARIVARARDEFEPECFDWVMSQGVAPDD
ncbi:MAG: sulfotransferase domain-containing protein [Deltaproteobacteria bacterium]|nr:sulfotransferase domain-containing protein [Deltaproteobacteria bacterium]